MAVIAIFTLAGGLLVSLATSAVGWEMVSKNFLKEVTTILSARNLIIFGLVACLIINWLRKDSRENTHTELKNFVDAARSGTMNSLKIGATVGVIGIITISLKLALLHIIRFRLHGTGSSLPAHLPRN